MILVNQYSTVVSKGAAIRRVYLPQVHRHMNTLPCERESGNGISYVHSHVKKDPLAKDFVFETATSTLGRVIQQILVRPNTGASQKGALSPGAQHTHHEGGAVVWVMAASHFVSALAAPPGHTTQSPEGLKTDAMQMQDLQSSTASQSRQ